MVLKDENAGIFTLKIEVGHYFDSRNFNEDRTHKVSGQEEIEVKVEQEDGTVIIEKEMVDILTEIGKEDLYVILREPTTEEALLTAKKDKLGNPDEMAIFKIMPKLIIEHNFEKEEGKQFSCDEVWKKIMKRSACASQCVTTWSENIPLAKGKRAK